MVVREKTFSYGQSFTLGMFVRGKAGVCGQHRREWSLRGFRRRVERPGYACCVWVRSAGSSYIRERRSEKRGREEERKRVRDFVAELRHPLTPARRRVRDFVAALRHPLTLAAGPLQATETQEPKAPVFASPAPLQASLRGAGNAKTQR